MSTFLFYTFHLTVGTTQFDAKAFAQLKGEWLVQSVVQEGKQLPAEEWKGRTVVFAQPGSPLKTGSAVFGGRLRTKGKMSWLETKTFSTDAPNSSEDKEYSGSYEIKGDTMKLLLIKVEKPNDRGPAGILENPDGKRGMLFFLKRK